MTAAGTAPLLQVRDLSTQFVTGGGRKLIRSVREVSFTIGGGESVALIGESGCGKSTVALSVLRVLPQAARITGGEVLFRGEDLLRKSQQEMTAIRGCHLSMILQDPMLSLDPVFTIGDQIGETLRAHLGCGRGERRERIEKLLGLVNISEPRRRMGQYPHEMSGGLRQRVVGAIALCCDPRLLIADEATTNLDVTIQLQYLELLREIQRTTGVALLFITHNLGIVAHMCRYVLVMYAGRIVERAPVDDIYDRPAHWYTRALLQAAFGLQDLRRRRPIPGEPPDPGNLPPGCSFHLRCEGALERCRREEPPETPLDGQRAVRCWNPILNRASAGA